MKRNIKLTEPTNCSLNVGVNLDTSNLLTSPKKCKMMDRFQYAHANISPKKQKLDNSPLVVWKITNEEETVGCIIDGGYSISDFLSQNLTKEDMQKLVPYDGGINDLVCPKNRGKLMNAIDAFNILENVSIQTFSTVNKPTTDQINRVKDNFPPIISATGMTPVDGKRCYLVKVTMNEYYC